MRMYRLNPPFARPHSPPTPMERERERSVAYSPQVAARELELAIMELIRSKQREAPSYESRMNIEAIHFDFIANDVSVDVVLK